MPANLASIFHGRGIPPKMEYVKVTRWRLGGDSFRGGTVLETSGLRVALRVLLENGFILDTEGERHLWNKRNDEGYAPRPQTEPARSTAQPGTASPAVP